MPVSYGDSMPVFPTYIPQMRGLDSPVDLNQFALTLRNQPSQAVANKLGNDAAAAQSQTTFNLEPLRAAMVASGYQLGDAQNQTGLTLEPLRAQQVGSGYQAQTAQNQTTMQLEPQRRVALGNQYDLQATQADQSNQAALANPEVPGQVLQRQGFNAQTLPPVDSFINGKMQRTYTDIHGNPVITQDLGLGTTGQVVSQLNHPPTEVIDAGDGNKPYMVRKINGIYYNANMEPVPTERKAESIIGLAPQQAMQDLRQANQANQVAAKAGVITDTQTPAQQATAEAHQPYKDIPETISNDADKKVAKLWTNQKDIQQLVQRLPNFMRVTAALDSKHAENLGILDTDLVDAASILASGGKVTGAQYHQIQDKTKSWGDKVEQFFSGKIDGSQLSQGQRDSIREVMATLQKQTYAYLNERRQNVLATLPDKIRNTEGAADYYLPPITKTPDIGKAGSAPSNSVGSATYNPADPDTAQRIAAKAQAMQAQKSQQSASQPVATGSGYDILPK